MLKQLPIHTHLYTYTQVYTFVKAFRTTNKRAWKRVINNKEHNFLINKIHHREQVQEKHNNKRSQLAKEVHKYNVWIKNENSTFK